MYSEVQLDAYYIISGWIGFSRVMKIVIRIHSSKTKLHIRLFHHRLHTNVFLDRIIISTLRVSSVATPICQEGQSERTFPIFAFSRFSSSLFSQFLANFSLSGGTLPPCPMLATPLPIGDYFFKFNKLAISYYFIPANCPSLRGTSLFWMQKIEWFYHVSLFLQKSVHSNV